MINLSHLYLVRYLLNLHFYVRFRLSRLSEPLFLSQSAKNSYFDLGYLLSMPYEIYVEGITVFLIDLSFRKGEMLDVLIKSFKIG